MAFKLTTTSSLSWRDLRSKYSLPTETLLDLAPLVDIIFTLILFFMLTSPLTTQWGITITLPALKNITPVTISEVEIIITADNQIFISGKAIDKTALSYRFQALAYENKPVTIISDTKAQLGTVLEVRDLALEAGIKRLYLRARVKSNH